MPVAEQPRAERTVLKQESAKVGGEGLHADTQTVEVVARRHIAQMLVDVERLNADHAFAAGSGSLGIGVKHAAFVWRRRRCS